MIVGDVMIDAYLFGTVDRISPEAPVPVVVVTDRSNRLGGAANVALNIKALGAEPILCAVIGNDQKGKDFEELLHESQMPVHGLVKSETRTTTTKFRILGNKVQMLRVDEEVTDDLNETEEQELLERIADIIQQDQIDAIILQDYNKGVLTGEVIKKVIEMAHAKSIPVAVDPKKKNFLAYKHADLFKPNLKELKEGLNISLKSSALDEVKTATEQLQKKLSVQTVLATLSEKGVLVTQYINQAFKHTHVQAHLRNIADVSGAGDTVISVATLCLALHVEAESMAEISNLAGGIVCEEVGVVPIDKNKLHDEVLRIVTHS